MAYCELFMQLGLEPREEPYESWFREIGDYLIDLMVSEDDEAEGEKKWWLTVVCSKEEPRFDFAGNLGACLMQYFAVVMAIQAGIFSTEASSAALASSRARSTDEI